MEYSELSGRRNQSRWVALLPLNRSGNSNDVSAPLRGNSHAKFSATDICVYGLLVALGAMQFGLSSRSDDFFAGDVTYFELSRSIVERRLYGFDFKPEALLPPGFPAILASLCVSVGCGYMVLVRSMAIFAALGFVLSYELLRREEGRAVAAISCVLLASSPVVFAFSTRMVLSDLPYFFTSMATLLLAIHLNDAKSLRARTVLGVLVGFCLVESLLIRSSGIALLTGLSAWLTVVFFADSKAASRRLKTFIPLLILGIIVQAGWMRWAAKHEALQWPMVGGYPQSYIKQLEMKNGNFPDLGKASLSDIPSRVARNLKDRAVALTELLTRKDYINTAWLSPLVFGPILLVLIGLVCSIFPGGGGLAEWYFVSHETMYVLWPWNFEIRFFLPVAPLACLYLWRGSKVILRLAFQKPGLVSTVICPVSFFMTLIAGASALESNNLQVKLATIFWLFLCSASSGWLLWTRFCKTSGAFTSILSRVGMAVSVRGKSLPVLRVVGVVAVAGFVIVGVTQQLAMGRDNLSFDMTTQSGYADVAAGKWIAANTASTAVVMARQLSVVYHYGRRKVIWFPPSNDARILMQGIRQHKVDFVIISERRNSYWLPPEGVCFESLLRIYPGAFRLVHGEPRFRIFKFVSDSSKVDSVAPKI